MLFGDKVVKEGIIMPLIERLMGLETPKVPVHLFQSVMAEWARGNMTGAQANSCIAAASGGVPLDSAATAEAQALVNTVPVGTTTANKADRALRLQEIDQILLIADTRSAPYNTAAAVRTRLGI